jgi:hypothetical protein
MPDRSRVASQIIDDPLTVAAGLAALDGDRALEEGPWSFKPA